MPARHLLALAKKNASLVQIVLPLYSRASLGPLKIFLLQEFETMLSRNKWLISQSCTVLVCLFATFMYRPRYCLMVTVNIDIKYSYHHKMCSTLSHVADVLVDPLALWSKPLALKNAINMTLGFLQL